MSFLSRLLGRAPGPDSSIDSVTYDDVGVTRHHASGRVDDVDWADLREVVVMARAGDRGRPDPHIVLTGQKASTIVNSRVQGADLLVTRLGKLAGFNQEAFSAALEATDRARVVCWQRGGPAPATGDAEPNANANAAPAAVRASVPTLPKSSALELALVPMEDDNPTQPATPHANLGTLRLDIAPRLDTVAAYAHDAVRDMARVYRAKMDGSLKSLVHIDRAIAEWHAGGAPLDAINKSLYSMGSYAGEVMLRHARGRWVEPTGQDEQQGGLDDVFLVVELEDGRRWAPIALCINALRGGPDYSLLGSARALLGTGQP